MKSFAGILSLIIMYSCSNNGNTDLIECKNLTGINDSLYKIILSYQKENPIPTFEKDTKGLPPRPETAFKYVYEVQFVSDKDSMVFVTLKLDGVNLQKENSLNKVYGIYQDSCLRPTYFVCDSFFSKSFLQTHKTDDLDKFEYNNSSIIDIMYVRYIYKVSEGKFYFNGKEQGNTGK